MGLPHQVQVSTSARSVPRLGGFEWSHGSPHSCPHTFHSLRHARSFRHHGLSVFALAYLLGTAARDVGSQSVLRGICEQLSPAFSHIQFNQDWEWRQWSMSFVRLCFVFVFMQNRVCLLPFFIVFLFLFFVVLNSSLQNGSSETSSVSPKFVDGPQVCVCVYSNRDDVIF